MGEACAKTDWQVHALCVMGNRFHLVVETPKRNLVIGMKRFLGRYTSRFNGRHKLFGHLFSGRYRALLVDAASPGCFRTVGEYVHLNPVPACAARQTGGQSAGAGAAGLRLEQLRGISEAADAALAVAAGGTVAGGGEMRLPKDSAAGRR